MFANFRGLQGAAVNAGTGSWSGWNGSNNGSNYPFNAGGSIPNVSAISVEMLDSTHFLLFFTNFSMNLFGCVVGTISGTSVSYGTYATITSGSGLSIPTSGAISSCLLAPDSAVVTWSATDSGGNINAYAMAISVVGTTAMPGTLLKVSSNQTSVTMPGSITALSATTCAVAYQDSTANALILVVLSLSSGALTPGTPATIFGAGFRQPAITRYTTGKILFVCNQVVSGNALVTIVVVNYSGSSIGTIGSPGLIQSFTSATLLQICVESMGASSAIVSYIIADGSGTYQKAVFVALSGNTANPSLPSALVNTASATAISNAWLEPLNAVNAMLAYTFGSVIQGNILTISGTSIIPGSPVSIESNPYSGPLGQAVSMIDSATVIGCGIDGSNEAVTKVLKP